MLVLHDRNVQCVVHLISWRLLGRKNLLLFDALVVFKTILRFNACLQGVQHYLDLVLDPNYENEVGFCWPELKFE